ncbi:MAG: hypothetical protein ACNI3A_06100 [Desulfovibrio sp.]|uniref:hypothetical protein n=1 Tax=Desulfovibrio sp. 7SRBS1 TaxID=3378064 RepID=UPI003B3F2162
MLILIMSYLTQLLQDPLAFGKKYPMLTLLQEIGNPRAALSLQSSSSLIPAYEVKKHIRADYFSLRDGLLPGVLSLIPTDNTDPDGKFCYWLPWARDAILKTELRPQENMPEIPELFFTATLDGCSVFFKGDPHFPVVYHANAENISKTVNRPKTRKEFRQRYTATGECMRSMHETLALEEGLHELFLDASVRFAERQIPKISTTSVSPMDYMGVEHSPTWRTMIPKEDRPLRSIIDSPKKFTIEVGTKSGFVFGVCKNKNWKFYLQKQADVTIFQWDYHRQAESFGKLRTFASYINPVDYWRWAFSTKVRYKSYQIPMSCEEVWPSGAGQVMI